MSSYLDMANKASVRQEDQKSIFMHEMLSRSGVTIIQLETIPVIDTVNVKVKFNFNDLERAFAFGFAVKTWSDKLNAITYLTEDLTLKSRLRLLVDENAIFTLKEAKLIAFARLQNTDLRAIHSFNALLGTTLVELEVTPVTDDTK
jgi:hypothetical protein